MSNRFVKRKVVNGSVKIHNITYYPDDVNDGLTYDGCLDGLYCWFARYSYNDDCVCLWGTDDYKNGNCYHTDQAHVRNGYIHWMWWRRQEVQGA